MSCGLPAWRPKVKQNHGPLPCDKEGDFFLQHPHNVRTTNSFPYYALVLIFASRLTLTGFKNFKVCISKIDL